MTSDSARSGGTAEESSSRPNVVGQMRARRSAELTRRTRSREARWRQQRLSVPYRTDGPKVTLGVAWFIALVIAMRVGPLGVVVVAGFVAVVAAVQSGHAWTSHTLADRRVSGLLAGGTAAGAFAGTFGLGVSLVLCALGALAYCALGVRHRVKTAAERRDSVIRMTEVTIRSALPVGLAAGSLGALVGWFPEAAVALVVLVSAYEMGDFLVGTGSANAIEGPVAGAVCLAVVAFGLYLVLPEPFDATTLPLFAALTAICCPVGQIAGSAVLPRGDAWAPALRRLDSYLIAAPLWLLLL